VTTKRHCVSSPDALKLTLVDATCPWGSLAPASIAFCEERLCSWVAEPSNAWSNIAFLVPAVWVLRRGAPLPRPFRAVAGLTATFLAATSFFFHATGSRVGELADVSSMYLLPALSLGRAISERGWLKVGLALPLVCWSGSTAAMAFSGSDGIIVWGSLAFLALMLSLSRSQRLPSPRYHWGLGVLASFGLAYFIWWCDKPDKLGWLCVPDNHLLTGHAVWHGLTALSVYFFFKMEQRLALYGGNNAQLAT
jgi:hypothetical protein